MLTINMDFQIQKQGEDFKYFDKESLTFKHDSYDDSLIITIGQSVFKVDRKDFLKVAEFFKEV